MMSKQEFNSRQELDNLVSILSQYKELIQPSQIMEMYTKVEQLLVRIYKLGHTAGFVAGVDFKDYVDDEIKDIKNHKR